MFRFSGLLVAVALALVVQVAQAQDTSQHITGGGRAQALSTGELWSVSVAVDLAQADDYDFVSASGHLRLRSDSDGVYDIAIVGGLHHGATATLFGDGAGGFPYIIEISEGTIQLLRDGHNGGAPKLVEAFILQRGHIGL